MSTIYLGAGCFWGVQHILDPLDGVLSTSVGYMGGSTKNPTYRDICTGQTGHAEVVKVEFDPEKISLDTILSYFWRLHDPTQKDRQGVDVGTQYRSVIFVENDKDLKVSEESKAAFDEKKIFAKAAVTEILKAPVFYKAEDYHQHYFENRGGPICHALRAE